MEGWRVGALRGSRVGAWRVGGFEGRRFEGRGVDGGLAGLKVGEALGLLVLHFPPTKHP